MTFRRLIEFEVYFEYPRWCAENSKWRIQNNKFRYLWTTDSNQNFSVIYYFWFYTDLIIKNDFLRTAVFSNVFRILATVSFERISWKNRNFRCGHFKALVHEKVKVPKLASFWKDSLRFEVLTSLLKIKRVWIIILCKILITSQRSANGIKERDKMCIHKRYFIE